MRGEGPLCWEPCFFSYAVLKLKGFTRWYLSSVCFMLWDVKGGGGGGVGFIMHSLSLTLGYMFVCFVYYYNPSAVN